MRKAKQFWAIAVGLALVLAVGSASAQQDRGMHQGQGMQQRGYGQGMQQGYAQGYAQMSPEQLQQMRQIQSRYADKMYDFRSRLYAKQQELSAAMAADEVNTSKVNALVSEINELRGKLFSARTEMQLEMRQQGLMPYYGGYGMGPGMMRGGRGMGPGMGPGMMHGGYGMGPGMMGPGMRHGRGMGPGMMHGGKGFGMGQGRMYGCPYQSY